MSTMHDYQMTKGMLQQLHTALSYTTPEGTTLDVAYEDHDWLVYESKYQEDAEGIEASCESVADFDSYEEAVDYIKNTRKAKSNKVKRKAGSALTAYFRALQPA